MEVAPVLNIQVLTWASDNALYFPNGVSRQISCNHVNEGNYSVNIKGERKPLPTTTIPALASPPGNQFQSQEANVQAGNVYGNATPFATGDHNYKLCVKVKDLTTLITYYLDAADYAANIGRCNFVVK